LPAVRLKSGALIPVAPDASFDTGAGVVVSIRPEQLRLEPLPFPPPPAGEDSERAGCFPAVIKAVMPLGMHVVYDVASGDDLAVKVTEPRESGAEIRKVGAAVCLRPASPAACRVFPSP
jgi:hypothetical protein